jgi:hypothetical protein
MGRNRRGQGKSSQNRRALVRFCVRCVRPRFRALPTAAALVATLLISLFSRQAWSNDIQVVVRTVTPSDRLLFERIVGHTSDLPATLREHHEAALEPDLPSRLETASSLAETGTRVVVWFEHPSTTQVRVVVAIPDKDRVLVREVGAARTAHELTPAARSALLEQTALVVSTALNAIEADSLIGVSRRELLGLTAEVPTPPTPPAAASEPVVRDESKSAPATTKRSAKPEKLPVPPSPAWHASVGAGWQVTVDGESPGGAHAGALSGYFEWRDFTVELDVSLGLPSRMRDDFSTVELSRHAATATVGRILFRTRTWNFLAGVGGGGVLFSRAITPSDPRLVPSASRTYLSPHATVEVAARYAATRNLGLMIVAAIDGVASPPTLAYDVRGGAVPNRSLWFFEPRASLFAFYAFH